MPSSRCQSYGDKILEEYNNDLLSFTLDRKGESSSTAVWGTILQGYSRSSVTGGSSPQGEILCQQPGFLEGSASLVVRTLIIWGKALSEAVCQTKTKFYLLKAWGMRFKGVGSILWTGP